MKPWTYYSENAAYPAAWLKNLMGRGLIPDGEIDTRSITEVLPEDLRGFVQCHFFAGIGGWPLALQRAGWPVDRFVWTGSCPCGPFSRIGKQAGYADPRHLWPTWARLIGERRPPTIFGEQVASATAWLRLVRCDLESLGYAVGSIPIEAACADAEHLRDRFWFVANRDGANEQPSDERSGRSGESPQARNYAARGGGVVDGLGEGLERHPGDDGHAQERAISAGSTSEAGLQFDWYLGADGKRRRVKSGLRLVADGIPAGVDQLRALGNAIDWRPAAAFIAAYMDCRP